MSVLAETKALFKKAFGDVPSDVVVSAPGRVNLIGEHTDYNEGFVMPFCIEQHTVIVAKRTSGVRCRVASANQADGKVFEFAGDSSLAPVDNWTNYMRGVVAQYLCDVPAGIGFDAAVVSNVPLGGGLSSSASLEVATATMIEALYSLRIDPKEKALRCQQCEHKFCNTPCGIMDQFISACGKKDKALLIDCRPPFAAELVPLGGEDIVLVVANSNVKHSLSGSEYPDRVRQCQEACKALRAAGHTKVNFLRDATLDQLAKVTLPAMVLRRARHGISENERTLRAKDALLAGDYALLGKLMVESHKSLKEDYEVSTPELDALVEIALSVDGVYGSRMTGGGFGGCTITLLRKASVPALLAAISKEYPKRSGGKQATCFVTTPAQGACVVEGGSRLARLCASLAGVSPSAWAALAVGAPVLLAAAMQLHRLRAA
ncbi:hypothetical protein AB1Y20_021964 [Prymnesium parvum]|uniref:Galactokinase n=1 Tax=Prymnesium parvum TaxID=97485 RepID=A0AB34JGH7_PRYPA